MKVKQRIAQTFGWREPRKFAHGDTTVWETHCPVRSVWTVAEATSFLRRHSLYFHDLKPVTWSFDRQFDGGPGLASEAEAKEAWLTVMDELRNDGLDGPLQVAEAVADELGWDKA